MFIKNSKILLSIAFLILFISSHAYSDLFESTTAKFDIGQKLSENTILHNLDFNGDHYPDLLIEDSGLEVVSRQNLWIPINLKEPRFLYGIREAVVLNTDLMQSNRILKYTILPPISNREGGSQNDSLVLVADGGKMELIRYLDDPELSIFDRYAVYSYTLVPRENDPPNLFSHIVYFSFGDVDRQFTDSNVDLFLVTEDGVTTRLVMFQKSFDYLTKETRNLSPNLIYDLPSYPPQLWFADIEKDEKHKDDIFFEYWRELEWHVWIADPFSDQYSRRLQFPVPDGVYRVKDILPMRTEYDLLVSVIGRTESDVAYVAFKKESIPLDQSTYTLVPVTIPGKHLQGAVTRLFSYENTNTGESYPIAMVYNQLDPQNPQPNPIYIYRIDPADPLSPQLVQTFISEYTVDGELYYFDRPEVVADFDQDGISDLMLMAFSTQPDTSVFRRLLGFAGISSDTKIPEWSLHEPR